MSLPLPYETLPSQPKRRRHLQPVEELPAVDGPELRLVPAPTAQPGTPGAPQQAQPPGPPEPPSTLAIQHLALLAFEVVEGHRPIAQLGGLISPGVIDALRERRAARVERRSMFRDQRRVVPTPGRPRIDRPQTHVLECAVVLQAEPRATAVALRFEIRHDRWQATHLTVL